MSGSSGTGLTGDTFVGKDGSIDVQALALTVIGGLMTTIGVGIGAVGNSVFQGAISLAAGLASFGSDFVSKLLGTAIGWVALAWRLPTSIVTGLTGLWVPIVALAVVLVVLAILGWSDE